MLFSLIKKELMMEFRSKQIILSMLFFGLAIILIFALSSNVSRVILTNYAPGMFWLMNLFIIVLGVHRSFAYEKDFDAFSILISSPIDRGLIFIAKWVSGFLFISVTQFVIFVPFFKLLLLEFPENTLLFLSTNLFINIAIMAVANSVISLQPFAMWNEWFLIIASIIVIFGLAGYALFDYVVEE